MDFAEAASTPEFHRCHGISLGQNEGDERQPRIHRLHEPLADHPRRPWKDLEKILPIEWGILQSCIDFRYLKEESDEKRNSS